MEIINAAMTNIGMLLYVIKTNDAREQNYRDTIKELTTALNGFEDLKNAVADIRQTFQNFNK